MGFIDSIKSFYFKTFDFRTRSSRSESGWYVILAQILFFLPISYPFFSFSRSFSERYQHSYFLAPNLFNCEEVPRRWDVWLVAALLPYDLFPYGSYCLF